MMKIVCPNCATVLDHGGVADDLLAMMGGVGILSVRCPGCGVDIDLPPDPDPRETARAWGVDVDRAVAA
jgi:phage FluMu protein Com